MTMTPRQFSILGYAAAFLALAVNPVLDALGLFTLLPGTLVAVIAPLVFAAVAVVCGLQVQATGDRKWGARIALSGLVAYVLGTLWGPVPLF